MKAQTFLEWFRGYPQNLNSLKDKNDFKLAEMCLFYSQPFKPELITELFEETDKDISSPHWFYAGFNIENDDYEHCIELKVMNKNSKYEDRAIEYDSIFNCPHPKTLNDFISDCQRAGIELTWKSEIERKYFV